MMALIFPSFAAFATGYTKKLRLFAVHIKANWPVSLRLLLYCSRLSGYYLTMHSTHQVSITISISISLFRSVPRPKCEQNVKMLNWNRLRAHETLIIIRMAIKLSNVLQYFAADAQNINILLSPNDRTTLFERHSRSLPLPILTFNSFIHSQHSADTEPIQHTHTPFASFFAISSCSVYYYFLIIRLFLSFLL